MNPADPATGPLDVKAMLERAAEKAIANAGNGHGPHPTAPDPERTIRYTAASTIAIRPVYWLWKDRLPLGTLGLIVGREGLGKSLIAYTLAADITRGTMPGAYHGTPKSVIVAATEDSWAHTIVPRLIAARADLTRIYRIDVVIADEGRYGTLTLPLDIAAIGHGIADHDAALVLLDPLMSRLSGKLDSHKDAEVRQALEPLAALADTHAAAVLGLIHVNKSSRGDALDRIMGSRAFASVARSAFYVMRDPDQPDQRMANTEKNNLGRTDLPTLVFRIENAWVGDTAEGPVFTGRVEWLGETDRTIADALADDGDSEMRTAVDEAREWLTDFLTINGRSESKRVKAEAVKVGHSERTLKRAVKKAGVVVTSVGFPRITYWAAPIEALTPSVVPAHHEPTCPRCGEKESGCDCGRQAFTDPKRLRSVAESGGYAPLPTSLHTQEEDGPTGLTGPNGLTGPTGPTEGLAPVGPVGPPAGTPREEASLRPDPTRNPKPCHVCGDPDTNCPCNEDLTILNDQ